MSKWGGARPGSGRWSKAELAALARGEADDAVAAIRGRPLGSVRAKRAELDGKLRLVSNNAEPAPAKVPAEPKKKPMIDRAMAARISEMSAAMAQAKNRAPERNPFKLPAFPPRSVPGKKFQMAMDSNLGWAQEQWSNGYPGLGLLGAEGLQFLGFPFLAELTQRPEYRVISETIADDATRKWIDFDVTGDEADKDRKSEAEDEMKSALAGKPIKADERKGRREDRVKKSGKMEKIKALKDDQARLEMRDFMYQICRDDGFFGRSHIFMNLGADLDTPDGELKTPIGDGRDATTRGKIAKGSLEELQLVESMWTYPTTYNAVNPLKKDFYRPDIWWVNGIQVHRTRLLTFVGHPVPNILKPAYAFGGLSLSQMAKPYVDIWLQTRQSVGSLIHSFSVMVLMTDMQTVLQEGGSGVPGLMARADAFNALRDNMGLFMVNKATEDFKNVSASLSGLHELQAQSQEHMMSVARIPDIKFTGINPTGLNASTDGTMRAYYDTIAAYQNRFMGPHLTTMINVEQMSLWGEIDPDITHAFEPLWEMSEKEEKELQKAEAERHQIYVDMGAFSPEEIRGISINDPQLPYGDLDPDDVPELKKEEEQGLEPDGGRPDPDLTGSGPGGPGGAPGGGDGNVVPFPEAAAATTTRSRTTAADAEFAESDHPRAPDGKFGSGSGGGSASKAGASKPEPGVYYHGSGGNRPRIQSLDPDFDRKLFVSENHEDAAGYGPNVSTVKAKPGAKIAKEGTPEFDEVKALASGVGNSADIVRAAEKAGYDAVHFANQKNLGTAIINRDKFDIGGKAPHGASQEATGALDPAKLTKVGAQMGSNPGGVYEAPDGKKFYVKKGKSPEHVKNELIAASLYDLAGAPTLNYRPVKGGGHIATEMAKLDKDNASKLSPAEIREAQKDFVAHAWLANWDAVGLGGDNLGMVAGKATPLDMGGALAYRAQGAPKGPAFGDKVGEINTLRDKGMNRDSARVFGSMTSEQMRESAERVTSIPDDDVRETVLMGGGTAELADKLVARKRDIAKRFNLATDAALTFKEDQHPRAPDGKFGSGGSSGKSAPKAGAGLPDMPDFLKRKPESVGGAAPGEHQTFTMPQYGLTRPPSHHADFFKDVKLSPEEEAERTKARAQRAAKIEAARQARLPKSSGDPAAPDATVVFSGAELPVGELNGVPFAPWEPPTDWAEVDGQADIEEGPVDNPKDKDISSGVIVREPDGRVWLMRPKGGYGGYDHTFPKGREGDGLSLQANAIKEAWEETGLKVRIKAVAGDYEGDMTVTRYYVAEREGGTPADASWEAEAVVLAPAAELEKFLNRTRDRDIAAEHAHDAKAFDEANFEEGKHKRDADGKFSSTGGGGAGGEGEHPLENFKLDPEKEKPAGLKHYKSPTSSHEFVSTAQAMIDKPAQKSSTFRWQINNLIKEAKDWFPSGAYGDNIVTKLKLKVAESWDKERQAALAKGDGDTADKIATKMQKLGWSFVEGANKPVAAKPKPGTKMSSKDVIEGFSSVLQNISSPEDIASAIKHNSNFAESIKGFGTADILDMADQAKTQEENAKFAQSLIQQAAAAEALKVKPTAAELEKAKKNVPLKLQYVPGAPENSPAAQKLVDEFNMKWAGKEISADPAKLQQKVQDFKAMQAAMVPLMSAQQQQAAQQQAEQQKNAQANAAKQAEALKKQAEQAKQQNAAVMKDLGISESEAEGFHALVGMLGGSTADVIQKFKSYEAKAKSHGYPITGFQAALISNYSNGGYGGINKALRSGSWTVAQHVYAKLMNKALQSMPKYEGVAKRGTTLPADEQAKYKVGHVIQEHGFTSASPTKPWSGNTQYTIKAIGKRASHIKKLSDHPGEDEVVFSARTYFKVTKVENSGGTMHVHMEELEHDV